MLIDTLSGTGDTLVTMHGGGAVDDLQRWAVECQDGKFRIRTYIGDQKAQKDTKVKCGVRLFSNWQFLHKWPVVRHLNITAEAGHPIDANNADFSVPIIFLMSFK